MEAEIKNFYKFHLLFDWMDECKIWKLRKVDTRVKGDHFMAPNLVIFPAFLWCRANPENVSIHPTNTQKGGREEREKDEEAGCTKGI